MAGSLNKVMLIGNLGADPEVKRTQDGRPIVNLRLATSDHWKDKQTGERRERTEWHRIVIFNEGLCGIAEQYLKKGSKLYLEGELQTRKWTDQQGADRYSTEVVLRPYNGAIVLLGAKGGDDQQSDNRYGAAPAAPASAPAARQSTGTYLNDEIPF